MIEVDSGEMPEGKTTEHCLELVSIENSNSLSRVTDEQLAEIKTWIEEDCLEYEVFPAFDSGPGPFGAGNEGLPGTLIRDDEKPTYVEGAIYVETLEWADDAQFCLYVTLPAGVDFNPELLTFVTDYRYTDVVVGVRYPGAHINWTVESEEELNREWSFYRCEKGELVLIDIEDHVGAA